MRNKLLLFRTMLIAIIMSMLIIDTLLWMTGSGQPFQHSEVLLTCALLWFVSIFFPQKSDDDWAGEF